MRLHRFYFDKELVVGNNVVISDEGLIHQLKDVFRLSESGKEVLLFNGLGGEFLCGIVSLTKKELVLHVIEKREKPNNKGDKKAVEVWLLAALIKKDNFEWVIQKATELGVSHVLPIISERSEKKGLNMERARKILIEASEQSGRVTLPTLNTPEYLDVVLERLSNQDEEKMNFLAFDPSGKQFKISDKDDSKNIAILIGPEGGWTEKELEMFRSKNILICNLGSQILRAETAAIAVTSLLLLS